MKKEEIIQNLDSRALYLHQAGMHNLCALFREAYEAGYCEGAINATFPEQERQKQFSIEELDNLR